MDNCAREFEYEEVFTVSDFARIFKLSENSVRTLIRQKRLNAIKIGGRYRITRKTIDCLFSQSEAPYQETLDTCYGMWEKRDDIKDGMDYVNALREPRK